jgi:ankyrin repeat protein
MPKPCIACYDISNVQTRDIAPWTNQIQGNPRQIDKDLIDGIFFKTRKQTEQIINAGADVNARDEFGHTALMHACQLIDDDKVKLILKKGANANLEDPEGLIAMDYIFIPANKHSSLTIQQFSRMCKKLRKSSSKFK